MSRMLRVFGSTKQSWTEVSFIWYWTLEFKKIILCR